MSFTVQMICDLPFHNPTVVSQLNVRDQCVIAYAIFIEVGCKFRSRLSRKHFSHMLVCLLGLSDPSPVIKKRKIGRSLLILS